MVFERLEKGEDIELFDNDVFTFSGKFYVFRIVQEELKSQMKRGRDEKDNIIEKETKKRRVEDRGRSKVKRRFTEVYYFSLIIS